MRRHFLKVILVLAVLFIVADISFAWTGAPVALFQKSVYYTPTSVDVEFDTTGTSTQSWMKYDWNFGDGNTSYNGVRTETHPYANTGVYLVTLTVTNTVTLINDTDTCVVHVGVPRVHLRGSVNKDYTFIQGAIEDAAVSGDTIDVDPGIYHEDIDFKNKDIILQASSSDPSTTIIHGTGFDSAVTFGGGETAANCKLEGFTITGGDTSNPPVYMTVEFLGDLNNPDYATAPCLSSDGDTLYFGQRTAAGDPKLYKATRSGDTFITLVNLSATPHLIGDAFGPHISDDEGTLYFHKDDGNGDSRIHKSTYSGGSWGIPAVILSGAANNESDHHPSLTQDELTMVWSSSRRPTSTGDDALWIATRALKTDTFIEANTEELTELSLPEAIGAPHISSDGLTIYFCTWTQQLYKASRLSITDTFGPPVKLSSFPGQQPFFAETTSYGTELYFRGNSPIQAGIWRARIANTTQTGLHGIIGRWKLDESSGNAPDSVGANDGTVTGATWSSGGGMIDGALSFDGDGDYVSMGTTIDPSTDQFSAFAWVRLDEKEGTAAQSILQQTGTSGRAWLYRDATTDKLASYFGGEATLSNTAIFGTTGQWHHVGLTFVGSAVRLYIDGQVDGSNSVIGETADPSLLIGVHKSLPPSPTPPASTTWDYWNGLIDDVSIYNRALSGTEIMQLYDYGIGGGGISGHGTSASISNCIITNNSARVGGGVHDFNGSLSRCIVKDNTAKSSGGGLAGSSATITNSIIAGNEADEGGGLSGCGGTVTNSTIVSNKAFTTCSGVYNCSSTITNAIIWHNGAGPSYSYSDQIAGTTTPSLSYSSIEGWTSGGTENSNGDPSFVDIVSPAGQDGIFYTIDDGLRLGPASLCIDQGNDAAGPSTDIMGLSRENIDVPYVLNGAGGSSDMGAYEARIVYHVKSGATGTTGSSWADADAFGELRDALANANIQAGGEVWVAAGTYKPTDGIDTGISFTMYDGVGLYGGFDGTENARYQRDSAFNVTTLSGDIDIGGSDDSLRVVIASADCIIDGFIIEKATSSVINCTSGSPIISNCTVTNSFWNGLYVTGGNSLTLTDCSFTNNVSDGIYVSDVSSVVVTGCSAENNGHSGMHFSNSPSTITNCISKGNDDHGIRLDGSSHAINGCTVEANGVIPNGINYGILIFTGASAEIDNCIIKSNKSDGVACWNGSLSVMISNSVIDQNYSGIACQGDLAILTNCVISRNTGNYGIAASTELGEINKVINCTVTGNNWGIYKDCEEVTNCIVYGNITYDFYYAGAGCNTPITYCAVGGTSDDSSIVYGVGTFIADPLFADASTGDYHLKSEAGSWNGTTWVTDAVTSPCIDTGQPWADYSNEPLSTIGRINIGAYGNTTEASKTEDSDLDGLSDGWEMAFIGNLFEDGSSDNDGPGGGTDGFTNDIEFLFGYDPANNDTAVSLLVAHAEMATSSFDPTNSETAKVKYWINKSADVDVEFQYAGTSDTAGTISDTVAAGLNQPTWNGLHDEDSDISEKSYYDVTVTPDGISAVAAGSVELVYDHEICCAMCNPYRILPMNNEITKITYGLTVDQDVVVNIYDPVSTENPFWTQSMPAGSADEVTWDGKNSSGKYISIPGVYKIEIKYDGMREKQEIPISIYK